MGRNEEVLRAELADYQDCKATLLVGIPNFLNKNLRLGGVLGPQAEAAMSSGDFATGFLVLVSLLFIGSRGSVASIELAVCIVIVCSSFSE